MIGKKKEKSIAEFLSEGQRFIPGPRTLKQLARKLDRRTRTATAAEALSLAGFPPTNPKALCWWEHGARLELLQPSPPALLG